MKKVTLLLFMLMMAMNASAQLALEGFETWPPANWTIINNAGPNVTWTQSQLGNPNQPPYAGDYAAFLERENVATGTTTEDLLVTPQFNVPASPQLRFFSRLTLIPNNLNIYEIRITTDPNPLTATYTTIQTWTEPQINPSPTTYTEKIVNIPASYVGQQVYLAFVMMGDFGDRWLIDNVSVVTQCLDPTTLTASNFTETTADLSWANPSGATSWEIEVVPVTSAPTGTGVVYSGPLPYQATGLTQDTDYKYYVRALCSPSNPSQWVGPFNFSTVATGAVCSAPIVINTLPYSTTGNTSNFGDDFEGAPGTGCGTTGNFLNGDEVVYAYTATFTGVISVNMTGNGANSAMFVYNSCANIGVSCVAGGTGNATTPVNLSSVSVISGTTYYIVISSSTTQSTPYNLIIQQVNCPPPTGLTATNMNATSANLTWNANGATSWEIVVQNAGAGIPAGAGTTTTINTNYNVTQTTAGVLFTPATTYEYYVRADCGTGNGTFSAWAGPFTFMTTQVATGVPYTENFEGTSGWSLSNGTQNVKWVIGTAVNNGGAQSLYVSQDNGATNTYPTGGPAATVHAYRDIQLPSPVGEVSIGFDWKSGGESTWDYIRVWSVPTTFVPTPGTQITAANSGGTQIGGNLNLNHPNWTTANFVVNAAAFAGQVRRIIFEWRHDGSGGTGIAGAIDNFNISAITCSAPSALALSNLGTDQATFTWTAPGSGAASYDYYFSTTATAPTAATVPTGNVVPATATVTGLAPSTNYYFWVRSNCGGTNGTSFWIGPVNFNTPQVPGSLPLAQDFEGTVPWTLSNGTQVNKWVVGTATSNSPTHSLYVSNDLGVTNNYTVNTTSVVHAYRDLQMPATLDQLSLSFDWKSGGESTFDYIRVWIVPVTFTPTPGTQITAANSGGVQVGGNLNLNPNWTTANYTVNGAAFGNSIRRLVFEWRNDGSLGTQPGAAIDNINFSVITCPSPTALTVSGTTMTTANVTWTPPASVSPTYDYYLSTTNTAPTAATAPTGNVPTASAALTGLEDSTIYYVWVRSNCGATDGNSFWIGPVQFNTLCGAFDVPFFEGFNTASTSEFCWTVLNVNGDTDAWDMNYATNPYEGNQVAAMYTDFNGTNNDDWLISPTVNLTGNQRLRFRYRVQSAGEPNNFEVKLSTTGVAPASFTTTLIPLTTYSNITYAEAIVNIDDATNTLISGPVNIGWHIPPGGPDGWRLYIDSVIIEDIPACPEPLNLEINCLSSTGANLEWTQGGSETEWEVAIVTEGSPAPTSGVVVDEPLYYAMGLTQGVAYTAYVRSVCPGGDEVGAWILASFTTPESSVIDAEAFCAGADGSYILFDNVDDADNAQEYGQVACLGSTPNPVWYYLQVEDAGQLNFQLIQNTAFNAAGNPTGTALDVDFVAWGPFTSLNQACGQIELVDCPTCPNNTGNTTFYPFGNIVDCSYSAAAVENFSIDNAQPGEIYAVLITNFNGDPGQIKLQQLASSTGSTNCNILYNVDLGADQILCGVTETTITATVTTPGASDVPEYQWFMDDEPITPTIVSTTALTQTIEVDEPGTHVYSVVITVPNAANTDPITDEVTVAIGPEVAVANPAEVTLCGSAGTAPIDLTTLNNDILGTLNPADYTVEYYLTETDANAGTNPIDTSTAFTATTQTIYVRIESNVLATCFDVVPQSIVVGNVTVAAISYAGSPYCSNQTTGAVTQTGNTGGTYTTSSTDLIIDAATGDIDITASSAGTYTVTYTVAATASCPEFTTTAPVEIIEAPTATISYGIAPYCSNGGVATVTQTGTTGGIYSSTTGLVIDPVTGDIDLATSDIGTYTVSYTIAASGNCAEVVVTAEVEITALPVATIAYAGTPYCSSATTAATVTQTGNTGGVYTASTTADGTLSIDAATGAINIAASDAGTYTVSYTIAAANGCDEVIATATVVITQEPDGTFTYDSATFCQNFGSTAIPTFGNNASAGTFTVTAGGTGLAIDGATGIINPSASAEGEYTITNTIAAANGCGEVTATFTVTILPAPIGTFSYAGPYCQNDLTDPSPILDGAAGTFSSDNSELAINASTGVIDLSESASGIYTVYNTIAATADCEEVTFSTQVAINATPMFVIVDGCENNTFSATVTPLDDTFDTDSASIVWTFGTATVSTSPTFIPTELGTYTITITSADGCINVMTHLVDSTTCVIQKGISPGDGDMNDNFDLTALDVTSLSIFNRYGQEVFSYGAYTDQWYGQDKNGKELPTGTYFYSLERSNGEAKTGWVYINRQN